MIRFYIKEENDDDVMEILENALDEARINFDYDSGGRLMIAEDDYDEVVDILDENGINYNEI